MNKCNETLHDISLIYTIFMFLCIDFKNRGKSKGAMLGEREKWSPYLHMLLSLPTVPFPLIRCQASL
jgi:hypothetical protein